MNSTQASKPAPSTANDVTDESKATGPKQSEDATEEAPAAVKKVEPRKKFKPAKPPPSETEIDAWALKQQHSITNWTAAREVYAMADDDARAPTKCTRGKGRYKEFWKGSGLEEKATEDLRPRARMTHNYVAGNPRGTSTSKSKDGCEP